MPKNKTFAVQFWPIIGGILSSYYVIRKSKLLDNAWRKLTLAPNSALWTVLMCMCKQIIQILFAKHSHTALVYTLKEQLFPRADPGMYLVRHQIFIFIFNTIFNWSIASRRELIRQPHAYNVTLSQSKGLCSEPRGPFVGYFIPYIFETCLQFTMQEKYHHSLKKKKCGTFWN